jgi:hypothetical protein
MMHTGLSPYQTTGDENKEFVSDMDSLLDRLSARQGKDGASTGIFGR